MVHYLDNAATTPVRPEAIQAAVEAMGEGWGNPSARYAIGTQAAARVKSWRADVAGALGCAPEEVVFTSCGTESDNWAIQAAVELGKRKGKHIVTTAIEHAAVLEPCRALERLGYEVTYLQPDRQGNISVSDLEQALRPDTVLVSMMLVNNELGTVLPVAEAARAIKRSGCPALLHCDAVQGFLKVPFTPQKLGVDLLSLSGHKIHAPKGIGAMYIRKGLKLQPLIRGGGQEEGLRSGTEATAQIAAFAAACRLGAETLDQDLAHMADLNAYAQTRLKEAVPGLRVLTQGGAPHILPITMPGYKSEVVVRFLGDRGICVSSGSACHKGKPSHVYAALKLPKKEQDGVLRVSFSYDTEREDVDALAQGLKAAGEQLFTSLS
ncbi:cysteine desulfurase family protein [Pseudoflavonifractor phocaeensis]|uniref:cysteine desulfurase family protein n=1 Tax=Pseudoflavonifractor phocaeensis TaxID=1870988 RepID=UPI001F28ECEC|nr:cysteine desulfurase family protein [Pseudoflavonifractor phocaeensis]MCF2596205.1 cysteine desulfurase [Pseudoflavonifractor phocaeensis]